MRNRLRHGVHLGALLVGGFVVSRMWLPAPAAAQGEVARVVVLRFAGWQNEAARDAVLAEVASYYELVSEDRAVAAAEEIDVDVSTPEGMQQVVEHLGVTMVVAGSIEGRGRGASTTIVVVDASGEELASRTGPSPTERATVAQAGLEAVQEAGGVLRQRAEAARLAEQRARDATAAAALPEEPPVDETPPEPAVDEGFPTQLLVALGGVRVRNVGSSVRDGGNRVHFLSSDFYPEIDLYAVLRPLGGSSERDLHGLLFALDTGFSAGISYLRGDGTAGGLTSFRVRVDVGYAYPVVDLFEIVGTIGVGVEGVLLDAPDTYASAIYTYLRPAVMGRLRAYEELVIIEAGLGGRIGLDGGDIAGAYGPGLFFGGVDVFLGLFGRIDLGLTWAARLGFTHYVLSFNGDGGTLAMGQTGEDQTVDMRFLLGYSF